MVGMGSMTKTGGTWAENATGLLWSAEAALGDQVRLVHRHAAKPGVVEEDWILVTEQDLHTRFTASMESPEMACVSCSGGGADRNGAHTVCALCVIEEASLAAAA